MACTSCRPRLASLSNHLSSSNPFLLGRNGTLLARHRPGTTARNLSRTSTHHARSSNEIRPLSGGSSPLTDDGTSSSSRTTTTASPTEHDALPKQPSALRQALASALSAVTPRTVARYAVHRATQTLYAACAGPGEYRIDEGERREGTVRRTREGEEVGYAVDEGSVWHRGR